MITHFLGWLVHVGSQAEHNCLMRYGNTLGLSNTWFWTDANDQASKGVWVHATDNKDLVWFNPRMTCGVGGGDYYNSDAGDAMLMSISTNKNTNGAWCDHSSSNKFVFICEGLI